MSGVMRVFRTPKTEKSNNCTQSIIWQQKLLGDSIGLVDEVAECIVKIRCRIVHNKAPELDNKIPPVTKDVNCLVSDIARLEFL